MEDQAALVLVEINTAQAALERAEDIGEIIDYRDRAMAFQIFANARGSKEAAQRAKILQLKAERKAGKWLELHVGHSGGSPSHDDRDLPDGVTWNESSRWKLEARLPEDKFKEWIDECLSTEKEISAAGLRRAARKYRNRGNFDPKLITITEAFCNMAFNAILDAINDYDKDWLLTSECQFYFETLKIPYDGIEAWAEKGCQPIHVTLCNFLRQCYRHHKVSIKEKEGALTYEPVLA